MQRSFSAPLVVSLCVLLACALAAGAAPSNADNAFAVAKRYYDLRLNARAATELTQFIAAHPRDARVPQAKFMLGRTYRHQQQYDKAIDVLAALVAGANRTEDRAFRAECHYEIAECYWLKQDFERAIKYYGYCLVLSGNDADLTARANYWMAECLYRLDRLPDAAKAYAQVPAIAPDHTLTPWAIYSLGNISLRQGDYTDAIVSLEKVTTRYQDSEVAGEATLMLGFAFARRAKTQQDAKLREADYRKADELFTGVMENEQATASARQHAALALAENAYLRKDYDRAETTYAKALAMIEPASELAAETQLRRGHVLYDSGKYREAAAVYAVAGASRAPGLAAQGQLWQGNSWYQVATKEKDRKACQDALAALRRFRAQAGDNAADAPHAALLIAFCLEDLAAGGDAAARKDALFAFQEVCEKWPAAREAGHARDGIARLTATMSAQELAAVVGKLPDKAAWSVDLTLARKEFQDGKYENALAAAKKVLDTNPTGEVMVQASYLIGACLQQTGRGADSIKYYTQALDAAPTGDLAPFALRGLVLAYTDAQRFAEARDAALALTQLPLGKEDAAQALLYLGNARTATQQFPEALAAYQQLVKAYPDSELVPLAYMGMAGAAEAKKDPTEAVARYREVIRNFPDHELAGEAFYRIGVKQAEQKQFNEAIEAFKNVPPTHRLADRAAYAIAWAYYDQGKIEEANAQFVRVAEQYRDSALAADSFTRVGEYWMEQKQYAKATDFFNRAFQIVKPGNLQPLVAYKLGVSAYYSNDYPLAVSAFDKVVDDYPANEFAMQSLFMKARSLDLQNQVGPARETYLKLLAKYPKGDGKDDLSLDAALGAGRCALAAKQYATARADLANAQQLYAEKKKVPGLLTDRAKAVMTEVQYYLAQSYYDEGAFAEAFKQYAAVPDDLEPWSSRALLQMARCSAQTNNLQDARDVLQSLVTRYPKSEAAQQAPQVAKELGLELKLKP